MNWVTRKIHLYNVTMGLYMLDWWERCLVNVLIAVLLWFVCYNTWRSATDFFSSLFVPNGMFTIMKSPSAPKLAFAEMDAL